jgi:acid phosphatase class B
MALKAVGQKINQAWVITKKVLVILCVWGLIFSVATISKLAVAFDYDDTLVNSEAAFHKASQGAWPAFTSEYWSVVNQAYDLESPKLLPWAAGWVFRLFGFRVAVITSRPDRDADGLRKEWRHLIVPGRFIFVADKAARHQILESGNYVLSFGDSDSDVLAARAAHVLPVRVKRSSKSVFKDDYHPGTMGEFVLPFSQF